MLDSNFNDYFHEAIQTPSGCEKVAAELETHTRDRLRELAFSDHILSVKPITKDKCDRSLNHDTLIKICDMEVASRSLSITFRGDTEARYVKGQRYAIPFYTIQSEKFTITEEELMAYEMPVTKIIENNTMYDMHEIRDREFTRHSESAVQATQAGVDFNTTPPSGTGNQLTGTLLGFSSSNLRAGNVESLTVAKSEAAYSYATDDYLVHNMRRGDFSTLWNMLDGSRLKFKKMVIGQTDWNRLNDQGLDNLGSALTSETYIDGYKYDKLQGRLVVKTIKTDLVREGNVLGYTQEEFLGRAYVLQDTKFYINKVGHRLEWWCWRNEGMAFGNIRSIVKMELYSGSVTPSAPTSATGYTSKIVSDEIELGKQNNRLRDGLSFPAVSTF